MTTAASGRDVRLAACAYCKGPILNDDGDPIGERAAYALFSGAPPICDGCWHEWEARAGREPY